MSKIRYHVVMSLDGYIAGPKGEIDWIMMDLDMDFSALYKEFDTVLIGRRTFEAMMQAGNTAMPGMKMLVFSRTLQQSRHPQVKIVADKQEETLTALRARSGKDIWLFGGGSLFHSLLHAGLVDTVGVSIIPVLLGGGIPLLPAPAARRTLQLTGQRIYKSGIVSLQYAVK